uniref:Uncharacterized protein n=1 Tax=Glossina pallidipes TaxID=7398 RepID=A0A1A9Z5F7_GLOPL
MSSTKKRRYLPQKPSTVVVDVAAVAVAMTHLLMDTGPRDNRDRRVVRRNSHVHRFVCGILVFLIWPLDIVEPITFELLFNVLVIPAAVIPQALPPPTMPEDIEVFEQRKHFGNQEFCRTYFLYSRRIYGNKQLLYKVGTIM